MGVLHNLHRAGEELQVQTLRARDVQVMVVAIALLRGWWLVMVVGKTSQRKAYITPHAEGNCHMLQRVIIPPSGNGWLPSGGRTIQGTMAHANTTPEQG